MVGIDDVLVQPTDGRPEPRRRAKVVQYNHLAPADGRPKPEPRHAA